MGEYAIRKSDGAEIKIGTCESMYYLRADQADAVTWKRGNVNPASAEDQKVIRFRFPWPDEDGHEPGPESFSDYDRSANVHGVKHPEGVEHHSVQFVAQAGYNVCLPCPESMGGPDGVGAIKYGDLRIFRNGFSGAVHISGQAYRNGNLALIARCGGCGALYNVPTLADAIPYIEACIKEAEAAQWRDTERERIQGLPIPESSTARWWMEVAKRIKAGYDGEKKEAVA